MDLPHSHSGLAELLSSSIAELHSEDVAESRSHEAPAAHVPVLLLGPNKSFNFLIFADFLLKFGGWEGAESLQPDEGCLLDVVLLHVFSQAVEMFARNEDNLLNPVRVLAPARTAVRLETRGPD